MNISNTEMQSLKDNGFLIKKNVFNINQIEKIKKIIKLNPEGRNRKNYFPINFKAFLIKAIKFDFKKIINSLYLLNIKKKLKLDLTADIFFEKKSKLIQLDAYYNSTNKKEILPWHSDQSLNHPVRPENFPSPDLFYLKFFFYLTNVGSKNGCTSYIGGSHKITHIVRECIYENKIEYRPFWNLKDLVSLITDSKNYEIIAEKLGSKTLVENFLKKAKIAEDDKNSEIFDFNADPGDLLIFNEGGLHKGSQPATNERIALRYLYTTFF